MGCVSRWWAPKVMFWFGLLVLSFFIPNRFFMIWGNYIALVGAALFILVQLVLLVDFAHTWSETCLENWEQSDNENWKYILLASTLALYLLAIALISVLFAFFAGPGCTQNKWFTSLDLVFIVMVTVLAVHPLVQEANPRSGISQSAMVAAYATYLVISAIANAPTTDDTVDCNPLNRSRGTQTTSIVIGAIFTFIAIVYSTSRTATQSGQLVKQRDGYGDAGVPLLSPQSGDASEARAEALRAAIESG